MEINEDNNTGTNLTDDIEFPPLQRRNSGRTPRGEKINELIEQLNTQFDDNATKLDNKKPPPTGEVTVPDQNPASPDTATLQGNLPDNSSTSNSPSNRALNPHPNNPAHEEDIAREESARNADTNQDDSVNEVEHTANDHVSPNTDEASGSGSSVSNSDTNGQGTNKIPTPAVQPVTEESRKLQEESMQKEALATPFKDGAEELDDDLEVSEEEVDTPGKDQIASISVPASASKEGHAALFNMGKTPKPKPRRSGLRQPSNQGGRGRTPRKKK